MSSTVAAPANNAPAAGHRRGWVWWAAAAFASAVTLYAVLVPLVLPQDPRIVDYLHASLPPSLEHPMGTDADGRDLALRLAPALRLSLFIAVVVAVVSTVVGVSVGLIAGLSGGLVDQVLMRTSDTVNALPHLVLGLVIVSMFKGSVPALVLAMVLTHWVTVARVVRAQTLALRHSDVISSAWLMGMPRRKVMLVHALPATLGQALISLTLTVPHIVWHESTFSFLGVGFPPHEPSLGTLLAQAQGGLPAGEWWGFVFPGAALVLTSLSIGVLGRGLAARWVEGDARHD